MEECMTAVRTQHLQGSVLSISLWAVQRYTEYYHSIITDIHDHNIILYFMKLRDNKPVAMTSHFKTDFDKSSVPWFTLHPKVINLS